MFLLISGHFFFPREVLSKDESTFECTPYEKPKKAVIFEEDFEKKLETFSNSKVVAQFSEDMLSKLIAAKSPLIRTWFAERQKLTETELVLEWRKYFANSFILQRYPHDSSDMNKEIEKFVDGLLKQHLKKSEQKKLQKMFDEIKKLSIATVESYGFSEPSSKALRSRIEGIELYFPSSLKTARNNSLPLDLVNWGVAYDPLANAINVGLRVLDYPNEETLKAVFAHEIGHSFDPCRWGAFNSDQGPWPFEKVGECLRSSESVGAQKRDDSKLEEWVKNKKISSDLAVGLKALPTCNKREYPPIGTQADQLPEVFADWFSAEVMAKVKNLKIQNLRGDLCDEKQKLVEGSSYIPHLNRLYGVYYAHPGIRSEKLAKDSRVKKYCAVVKEAL